MSMGRYKGVNGVARKVTKRYRGVDGVAREIIKGYRGVDGVARQFFAAGIEWRKYSCMVLPGGTHTIYDENGVDWEFSDSGFLTSSDISGYADYMFTPTFGYGGSGGTISLGPVSGNTGVLYNCYGASVSLYEVTRPGSKYEYYCYTKTANTTTTTTPTTYHKGDTDYGSVYAQEGEAPEEGTLLAGSYTGSYCVISVGGTYYYYEKIG